MLYSKSAGGGGYEEKLTVTVEKVLRGQTSTRGAVSLAFSLSFMNKMSKYEKKGYKKKKGCFVFHRTQEKGA